MLSAIRNRLRRARYQSVPVVMSTAALSLSFLLPEHAARAQAVDLGNGQSPAQAVRSQPIVPDAAPRPAWMDETGVAAYFNNWFRRVARAQSQQPAWIAGLVTPPPILVEQVRYDQYIQHLGNGANMRNFGVNKGLQLIISGTQELDIVLPAYMERDNRTPATGFSDWQAFQFKQRLLSANAKNGNYILSATFALTAPTGSSKFTNNVYFAAPSIGFGKGWGDFNVQGNVGASLPMSRVHLYGDSLVGNLMFQYRFEKVIWPDVELNWTKWLNGTQRGGKNQLFMTVGATFGKFTIHDRLGVVLGIGYQFPLAPSYRTTPALLPTYSRNWIGTIRMPF